MKQLLTLLLLIPTLVFGQGNTTITANDTTFSMGGVVYNRGDVNLAIPTADSTRCAITSAYDGHVIITQKAISKYKRSNGVAFNAVSLCAYFDSFMTVKVSGGGGVTSITAGTGLSGGTITTTGTVALNGVLPAITSVNAIPAVGNGIPVIVAKFKARGLNDTVTAINYTPVSDSGLYEVTLNGYVTTQRVNSIALTYTPPYGSAVTEQLYVYTNGNATATNSLFGTGGVRFDLINPHTFRATSATNIKVIVTGVSNGGTTLDYALNVVLRRID